MKPRAYYNENDPKAAAWLRELIKHDLIAPGDVDERSICDVRPEDLDGYTQCHFFAGIGGWSYALRLAGWPDARPVWSGSCPCQPFSAAGKQKGHSDARHLWPDFLRIISVCRPHAIFGEQVAGAVGHGWLDGVCVDLEAEDYAVGQIVLPACSVGAPHIRQRMWWVADAGCDRPRSASESNVEATERGESIQHASTYRGNGSVADTRSESSERRTRRVSKAKAGVSSPRQLDGNLSDRSADGREAGPLADTERDGRRIDQQKRGAEGRVVDGRTCAELPGPGRLAHAIGERGCGRHGTREDAGDARQPSPWNSYSLVACRDGKARRVESGTFPLAHGIPARVGRLRGYGNAIVPQVAAEFIGAYLDVLSERGIAC